MPKIMQSTALVDKYNELLALCRNIEDDLAAMDVTQEEHKEMSAKLELYSQILIGMKAASEGRVHTLDEVVKALEL